MTTCAVDGCGGSVHRRGWCSAHYQRWLRNGDPLLTRRELPGYEIERFLRKVEIADGGCWLWTGATTGRGYGQFWYENRVQVAHRAGWTLLVGPIPAGLDVDHLCFVPLCVNPDHLEPVTRAENLARRRPQPSRGECKRGHGPEAGYVSVNGHWQCRECRKVRYQNQTAEQRAKTLAYKREWRRRQEAAAA